VALDCTRRSIESAPIIVCNMRSDEGLGNMGYVAGFKYDVFVSYPRENNQTDPEGVQWVRELTRYLGVAINNKVPSKDQPNIFFDDHDFEGGQLVQSLLDSACQAAIFLAIVSPPYVAPGKFTLKELDAFCRSRPIEHQIIVSLYFLPISDADEPPELRGPKKFDFYWKNENDVAVPLSSRTDGKAYISKLYTVADHIINRLDEIRRRQNPPPEAAANSPTLLLGHVTDDLVDARDELKEYANALGASALSAEDLPAFGAAFKNQFIAELERSDLFIQLLSKVRSQQSAEGHNGSCAQFQYNAAVNANKPTILWREPSDISKVQHYDRQLLELASAMSLEQLKTAIKKKLDEFSRAAKQLAEDATAPRPDPYIYITAHREDLARALELKEVADGLGAARIMEDDRKLQDFIEQVPYAEAIVFLYGEAPRKFVDDWLAKYLKLKATQFKSHPQLEGVYFAPPPKNETERRLRTGWRGLRAFGSQDAFSAEDMRRIFAELRNGVVR
jgi:hypothetical protein